jgi:hypothetical protein
VRLILFDLGRTLEDGDVLLPGALETLEAITALRAGDRPGALLGLVSDFDMPAEPSDVPIIRQRYYDLLDHLGIRSFFEPLAARVTLSTEVGVFKPDEAIFRAATVKAHPGLELNDVLFVTENLGHVLAARRLGLAAVHVRGPGQAHGDVDALPELVSIVRAFIESEDTVETAVVAARSAAADRVVDKATAAPGVTWTRLGDVLVLRGPGVQVGQVLAATGAGAPARRSFVPGQHLHLVTQVGRLFQHDHPDVPVVVDKGRFLVVDLGPDARSVTDGPHAGCYGVRPLPPDTVVFAQRDLGPRRPATLARDVGGRPTACPARRSRPTCAPWPRCARGTRPVPGSSTRSSGREAD